MWWRLIVLVLSIVVIIIIQQFDDVKSANLHIKDGSHELDCIFKIDMNALQSPIFIRTSRCFSEHPLMDNSDLVRKSANLLIQLYGSHGLICIFKID